MKFLSQTKDGVIDNLLRAYVSRPTSPHQMCPDFDPDRANAYIERGLTGASRLHYEEHLADCAACRKNVVALVRLAETESLTTVAPVRAASRPTWLAGAKRVLGAMSQPQWAMAATAVIVLAISLPLLLSRNQGQETSNSVAQSSPSDKRASAIEPASPVASPKSGDVATSVPASNKLRENNDEKTEVLARKAPTAEKPSDAPAGPEAAADLAKKLETRTAGQTVDEAQRKSDGQLSQAAPQAGAAPGFQVAKNESEQARQKQPEKDSAQQPGESKVAARTDDDRSKEKGQRSEEIVAPPAPTSEVARARTGMRRNPPKLSLRDSETSEAVRPEERKFSGKKFLFKDGAWTDKDFDPNKDLPVVTLVRDSNVYKELLSKRPGLKPFLTGFPATERAIIVYKGTVYKLIPQ